MCFFSENNADFFTQLLRGLQIADVGSQAFFPDKQAQIRSSQSRFDAENARKTEQTRAFI